MLGRRRRDPAEALERASQRLLTELREAAVAIKVTSKPTLAAATHLYEAACQRIKENEGDRTDGY